MSPGELVFTGRQRVDSVEITSIHFGTAAGVRETEVADVAQLEAHPPGAPGVQWVNVVGLHDVEVLRAVGERFGLHPLALEDVASVGARPHLTRYEESVFISLKMLTWTENEMATAEHVSLVLGSNWVLSFQERSGDVLDGVRERIRRGSGRVATLGADYLWYALLDAIVDNYVPVMEELEQLAEGVEERVWTSTSKASDTGLVLRLRGEALEIRRALRPLREEVEQLRIDSPSAITPETRPFLDDLHDHVRHLSDTLDGVRDTLAAVMEAHLAVVSLRTNEVMKVLTIMASIFIPLTFIVGVYGMNFRYMPELDIPWAYPLVWVVMGRHVPWEWAWFIAHGKWRKAFRRLRKGGVRWRGMQIIYPTPTELSHILRPHFDLGRRRSLGLVLPPTYASGWLERSPRVLAALVNVEHAAQRWQALAAPMSARSR